MPVSFTFARRLDEATVTVACGEEMHTVTANLDGTMVLHHHDADAEAVYAFLGGEITACQRVANMMEAVLDADRARRGIATIPGYTFVRRTSGWGPHETWTSATAPRCHQCASRSRGRTAAGEVSSRTPHYGHLLSPGHIAEAHDLPLALVRKTATWVTARIADPDRLTATKARALAREYAGALSSSQIRDYNLTPRFMRVVSRLPGTLAHAPQFAALDIARAGLTAPWLAALLEEVTPAALTRAHNFHNGVNFVKALASARNIDPRLVAQFINGGIYSNFYTYAKFRVTPAQALQVYRVSEGNYNLATALRSGLSLSQALSEARAEASAQGDVPA